MEERNPAIDLIKVVAMLMVIGMHTNIDKIIDEDSITRCVSSTCGIAIPLFFMVSGFLVSSRCINTKYVLRKICGILKYVLQIMCICLLFSIFLPYPFLLKNFYIWFIQEGDFWQFWYFGSMVLLYIISPFLNKLVHSHNAMKYLLLFMFICFCCFLANISCGFEQKMIQTFLLWEWIMYYLAGGIIRVRYNQNKLPKVRFEVVILLIVSYRVLYSVCGIGNQYLFGSVVCLLYSSTLFVYILNKKIPKWCTRGGMYFLPVYTIHIGIIHIISHYNLLVDCPPIMRYLTYFVLVTLISMSISRIILEFPFCKNIFKL